MIPEPIPTDWHAIARELLCILDTKDNRASLIDSLNIVLAKIGGRAGLDYKGKPFIHIPQEVKNNLEAAYEAIDTATKLSL